MPASHTEHTPVATENASAATDASDASSLEKAGNAAGGLWSQVVRMLQRVWDMIASLFGKKSGDDVKAVPASSQAASCAHRPKGPSYAHVTREWTSDSRHKDSTAHARRLARRQAFEKSPAAAGKLILLTSPVS
eukprot:TRINITY_DN3111_c0_g1_i2.p2 TRINITY_DN3111_c0_g1~~TRINITY_DN3111_c0_g1_i2.p2  ORF type:complete len:134 (+),score=11.60 TRINITY_DN3111_c0_g1_i2:3-404(+)